MSKIMRKILETLSSQNQVCWQKLAKTQENYRKIQKK